MKSRFLRKRKYLQVTQAKDCLFCLHIGTTAWYIGRMPGLAYLRLELFTAFHLFRVTCNHRRGLNGKPNGTSVFEFSYHHTKPDEIMETTEDVANTVMDIKLNQ